MQDLKEKKEKVEEKAGRKERKKEVVEVWRPWSHFVPTSFLPPLAFLGVLGSCLSLDPSSFFITQWVATLPA